jgi:hypothetical protein
MGTGMSAMREPTLGCEALAMWVEATRPVTTSERANARRIFFMWGTFRDTSYVVDLKFVPDEPDVVTLGMVF